MFVDVRVIFSAVVIVVLYGIKLQLRANLLRQFPITLEE